MRYLAIVFALLASFASAQTFPPAGAPAAYDGGSVTNPFLAPVGCGATPGYAFTGRTAEGLCSPSAGKLSIVVPGGTEVFQISDTNLDLITSAASSYFMEGSVASGFLRIGSNVGFGAGGNSELRLENGASDFVRVIVFDGSGTSTTDFNSTNTTFTDQILLPDGTDALKAWAFASDTDQGCRRVSGSLQCNSGSTFPRGQSGWSNLSASILFFDAGVASNGLSALEDVVRITVDGSVITTWLSEPAAGLSGDVINTATTLAAMDGADTVNVINNTITNAVHTGAGNELHGFNVEAIVASVSEDSAYYVEAGGWDFAFRQGGPTPMNIASDGSMVLTADTGAVEVHSTLSNLALFAIAGDMVVTVDDTLGDFTVRDESLNAVFNVSAGNDVVTVSGVGRLLLGSDVFANLGAETNGSMVYCSDCTKATPCAGAGSGAFAKRINAAWDCD